MNCIIAQVDFLNHAFSLFFIAFLPLAQLDIRMCQCNFLMSAGLTIFEQTGKQIPYTRNLSAYMYVPSLCSPIMATLHLDNVHGQFQISRNLKDSLNLNPLNLPRI